MHGSDTLIIEFDPRTLRAWFAERQKWCSGCGRHIRFGFQTQCRRGSRCYPRTESGLKGCCHRGFSHCDAFSFSFSFACAPEVDAKGLVVPVSLFSPFFNSLICFLVKGGVDVDVESTSPSVGVVFELPSEPKPSRTSCFNASTSGLKSSVATRSEGSEACFDGATGKVLGKVKGCRAGCAAESDGAAKADIDGYFPGALGSWVSLYEAGGNNRLVSTNGEILEDEAEATFFTRCSQYLSIPI